MRIALVGPVYPYRGGIAQYTTSLTHHLIQAGHQAEAFSFSRQYPAFLYPGKTDKDPGQPYQPIPVRYLLDPLYPWTWLKTAQAIRAFAPGLLVVQWWVTFWAPAYLGLLAALGRRSYKTAFSIHNVLPHEARPWDKLLAGHTLRQADAFLAHTDHERERLLALLPAARTVTCPLPVFDMLPSAAVPQAEARQRLGLRPDLPVVLSFGLVRPYKGVAHLLTAAAALRDQGQPVQVVVAGEFWADKPAYLQQISDLGLQDLVRIDDRYIPNDEVGLFFSAADVCAAAYTGGTQSAVLKLAMSYGARLVISETIRETLAPEMAAGLRVVPPADPLALAEAIRSLLQVPAPGPQAAARAAELSWRALVKAVEALAA